MACHAVVQRILLESLAIVEVDARTSPVAPVMSPPADLDMTPMFADDGFLAGRSAELLTALKHMQHIMPRLGLRFSVLEVTPAEAVFDRSSILARGWANVRHGAWYPTTRNRKLPR